MKEESAVETRMPLPLRLLKVLLAFLFSVVLPLFVTWVLPSTWIVLSRAAGEAHADVYPSVLLVIPVGKTAIEDLESVQAKVQEGHRVVVRDIETKTNNSGTTEDQGSLLLRGARQEISVPVSPATLDRTRSRVESFLNDQGDDRRVLYTVANWKFGFLLALPLCLLAYLWIVGIPIRIVRGLVAVAFLPARNEDSLVAGTTEPPP